MDIFFMDPNDAPVPPEEVAIRYFEARPYPDGRRVAVRFEVTPFQKRPNMEVTIWDQNDIKVAELSVVEAIENKMDFTMHLRQEETAGSYTARMRLFYTNFDEIEEKERAEGGEATAGQILEENLQTTDNAEFAFTIEPEDD